MALSGQLKRLGKQSAIYGLGGLVSRILAVLLLPLYTRYLSTARLRQDRDADRARHGARRSCSGSGSRRRSSASTSTPRTDRRTPARAPHVVLVHDDDGDARPRRSSSPSRRRSPTGSFGDPGSADLVRASAVALWAQMNYEQLTSLFRVEERSVAFVIASLANVLLTVGAHASLLVVVLEKGPLGVIVGNFIGTLIVYLALLGYRREQLGLQFDRRLLRADEPLRHAARSRRRCFSGRRTSATASSSSSSRTRPRSASTPSACASRRRWCSC